VKDFIRDWVVAIMGAAAGAALGLQILAIGDIYQLHFKVIAVVVGVLLGGLLGKKLNEPVKYFGTAFIGAFLIVRGLSFYFGGWSPDDTSSNHQRKQLIFTYLGVALVLFFSGALVQYKYVGDGTDEYDEDKDDHFIGE